MLAARTRIPSVKSMPLRMSPPRRLQSQSLYDRSPQPTVVPPRPNIYRDLWPAILGCLGAGYVVFYSLELWRSSLDHKWQAHDHKVEIERLKAKVEELQAENEKSRSGFFSRTPPANSEASGGRKKWLGIF